MTSVVVEDLESRYRGNINMGIAFWYCDYKTSGEQSLEQVLGALLKQLVKSQPTLSPSVEKLYDEHNGPDEIHSISIILNLFHTIAASYDKVFILVDALDEYKPGKWHVREMLGELYTLQRQCSFSLWATSRKTPDIETKFGSTEVLEIRAAEKDVRQYLEKQMHTLADCVVTDQDLQKEIIVSIFKSAEEM